MWYKWFLYTFAAFQSIFFFRIKNAYTYNIFLFSLLRLLWVYVILLPNFIENSSKVLLLYHILLIAAIVMCSKTIFLCFLMLMYAKQSMKAIMYTYILCLFNWIRFFPHLPSWCLVVKAFLNSRKSWI